MVNGSGYSSISQSITPNRHSARNDSTHGGGLVGSYPTRPWTRTSTSPHLGVGNGGQPRVFAFEKV